MHLPPDYHQHTRWSLPSGVPLTDLPSPSHSSDPMPERSLPQVLLILGIMAIAVAAWLGRYDIVAVGAYEDPAVSQQGEVMLLDRWTGRVNFCFATYVNTACYSFDSDPAWDT